MYEKKLKLIDTNTCSVVRWYQEVRGMKKILELVFIYLLGVFLILTLAFRVNEIDKESISNTSVASNYTINLTNYE